MDENTIRRVQPHNEKAEQGIVGTMLVNRDAISDLVDMLTFLYIFTSKNRVDNRFGYILINVASHDFQILFYDFIAYNPLKDNPNRKWHISVLILSFPDDIPIRFNKSL